MKQTHRQKVKLARRLRTSEEVRDKVNLFDSKAWLDRKESRIKKQKSKKIIDNR